MCSQSSEELDTDTEFEPVEDMTLETRSRCNLLFMFCLFFANYKKRNFKLFIICLINSMLHAYSYLIKINNFNLSMIPFLM